MNHFWLGEAREVYNEEACRQCKLIGRLFYKKLYISLSDPPQCTFNNYG